MKNIFDDYFFNIYKRDEDFLSINIEDEIDLEKIAIKALNNEYKDRLIKSEFREIKNNYFKNLFELKKSKVRIQILEAGVSSTEIEVPLKVWDQYNLNPKIIILAIIDEENNMVNFKGALTIKEIREINNERKFIKNNKLILPIDFFIGGIERYFCLIDIYSESNLINRNYNFMIKFSKNKFKILSLFFLTFIFALYGQNRLKVNLAKFLNKNSYQNNNLIKEKKRSSDSDQINKSETSLIKEDKKLIAVQKRTNDNDQINKSETSFIKEDKKLIAEQKTTNDNDEINKSETSLIKEDKKLIAEQKRTNDNDQKINKSKNKFNNLKIINPKFINSYLSYNVIPTNNDNNILYETTQRVFIKTTLIKNSKDKKLSYSKDNCFINNDIKITYSILYSMIENSYLVDNINISCDEAKLISKFSINNLFITSGRKNKVATVCLSDDKNFPCKFILGKFKKNLDSTTSLLKIFNLEN